MNASAPPPTRPEHPPERVLRQILHSLRLPGGHEGDILKPALIALLMVVATCLVPRLRHPLPATHPVDFNVYYTASLLVHEGHASALYTGADTGADPQKAIAAVDTPIYRAAQSQGLSFVGLYVYPPLLADLLLPLTMVGLKSASQIWLMANGVFLLVTALLLIRLLRISMFSAKALLVVVPLVCFTPALQCLVDGQITIFLLLLWAAGMVLYKDDHVAAAGVVFALATAIKLTPAVVLLPFLIWRTWRFVGAFLATLLCLAALCLWVDTPQTFVNYFTHVMPAMSGAIPFLTNFSLAAATQRLITVLRTGYVAPFPDALATSTVLAGRITAAGTLLALLGLIAHVGKGLGRRDRVMVLGLLSLAAPVLSPVSWFHAYAMAFIAFALLWQEALRKTVSTVYLVALTAVSLLLGSAVSENALPTLMYSGQHAMLASCLQFGQLALALAVIFYRIWEMRDGSIGPDTRTRPAIA
ncbi:MAG: glycosyltransferase family 87 protein [Janthinobacterium lividum]